MASFGQSPIRSTRYLPPGASYELCRAEILRLVLTKPSQQGENEKSGRADAGSSQAGQRTTKVQGFLRKKQPVADVLKLGPDLVITASLRTKRILTENMDQGAEVADIAKGVSVVSSGFQAVALVFTLASIAKKSNRGRMILPVLFEKASKLFTTTSEILVVLLNPFITVEQELI